MIRSGSIAIVAALAIGALAVPFASAWLARHDAGVTASRPVWNEVRWPFPIDEWGTGKAFRCKAADCGAEVNVYLRAKIGFCNCLTGVADDAELERLSDFALMGGAVAALGDGRPIAVGWMNGRSRAYQIAKPSRGTSMLSIAFNDNCDALVASAVVGQDRAGSIEPTVIAFLNGQTVVQWAKVALGQ